MAGRRVAVLWRAVDRVDVGDAGVTVSGRSPDGRRVRVRARAETPDYSALARRVVAHAHAHRRPLAVDGHGVEALSLDGLTVPDPARTQRGGSAEAAG